jgi:hypothetical protein
MARAPGALEQDVGLILSSLGSRGLENVPGIGAEMAVRIDAASKL